LVYLASENKEKVGENLSLKRPGVPYRGRREPEVEVGLVQITFENRTEGKREPEEKLKLKYLASENRTEGGETQM
jgi:hypothetical protein